jgi:ABC-type bacteriocin/lantibiotic exporter with double-glycine peptidase domain
MTALLTPPTPATSPPPAPGAGTATAAADVLNALARPLGITVDPALAQLPLHTALHRHGVMSRPVSLGDRVEQPTIAFADGHPVALLPGKVRNRGALEDRALTLYRPLPAGTPSVPGLLRFALAGARADVARLLLAGLLASVLGIAVPVSAGTLLPRLGNPHPLVWTVVLLGAAVLSAGLALQVRNSAAVRLQGRIQAALEPAVWARLLAHDVDFFRGYSTGDLVQRTNAIAQARQGLSDALVSSILGAFFSIAGLAVLIGVTPVLGLILLAAVLVTVVALIGLARLRQRAEAEVIALHGEINGLLYGLLRGIDKLQAAGREGAAFARWAVPFTRMKKADADALRVEAVSSGLTAALQSVLLAALLAAVALRGGTTPAGHLLAAGVAAGQIALAIGQVAHAMAVAYGIAPALQRLAPVLAQPRDDRRAGRDPGRLRGAVELRGVSYTYADAALPALDHLSLRAAPGEFVAIVGPSGAGKSTIVRMLLGFDTPSCGSVHLDDMDLADLDLRAVRRQLGSVLQHGRMLQGTLLDNIAGPSPDTTEDDVWEAAELAGIADFVRSLPMGLRTRIGENAHGFSGGQVQRLLIARALVRRPPILLLDEATSALDNTTQARVAERIAALDCTRIVIAHRLSTIRRADRIYVLDGGRVRASGTYRDLLDTDRLFTRLVRPQEL